MERASPRGGALAAREELVDSPERHAFDEAQTEHELLSDATIFIDSLDVDDRRQGTMIQILAQSRHVLPAQAVEVAGGAGAERPPVGVGPVKHVVRAAVT